MSLIDYAKSELARMNLDKDGIQDFINHDILEIIEKFSSQGHSGTSANYVMSILGRLLRFKPISPLTGDDEEWVEVSEKMYQNKRCPSVFKNPDGRTTDVNAIIVSDDGGVTWFSGSGFRKVITFPYDVPTDPERMYIEYTGLEDPEYEIITDKPERIKFLYEKKRKEYSGEMER